ncbi:hypothetical protein RE428_16470 [Marinobacter nanhaiticus D15-8W]|uniref:BLUF domain-containing protein n=1 Tax=Marinobacter nanhaiticus D15-8W TaxID=626887 RepID=N6VT02_9GAMM|nr:BLUF domain-containing protein [Marinobacter nanhaiticus]ENO13265.1 BLUF domain-containing protein [Marinobacter nanhaiticus D15-8W]BES70629.1 hypothetical protein RE428_16470 [Marinobacter nanhaiticus D15-8W]
MGLIRLVYASEATFAEQPDEQGIEPHVGRILMASRRNNPTLGLVGGLYYGDGHFFQCLEGESGKVHDLYNRIRDDDRHRKVTLLLEEPIDDYAFEDWSMKYVPLETSVTSFLNQRGLESFDPFAFDAATTRAMVHLMRRESDRAPTMGAAKSLAADSAPAGMARAGLVAVAVVIVVVAIAASWFLV